MAALPPYWRRFGVGLLPFEGGSAEELLLFPHHRPVEPATMRAKVRLAITVTPGWCCAGSWEHRCRG